MQESVKAERKSLAIERALIREELESEKKRLAATLAVQRAKLNAKLVPLRNQLAEVEAQIEAKNRELEALPVKTLLDQMARDDSLGPFNQASKTLIELLKTGKNKTTIVEKRIKGAADAVFKANVLYVLYQATKEQRRFDALLAFMRRTYGRKQSECGS